eukprot:1318216-Rhodomonas_salina.2
MFTAEEFGLTGTSFYPPYAYPTPLQNVTTSPTKRYYQSYPMESIRVPCLHAYSDGMRPKHSPLTPLSPYPTLLFPARLPLLPPIPLCPITVSLARLRLRVRYWPSPCLYPPPTAHPVVH